MNIGPWRKLFRPVGGVAAFVLACLITTPAHAVAPVLQSETGLYSGVNGGASIQIDGTDLGSAAITVGGNPATITFNSATQVIFTTPAGAVGYVDIALTTPGGTDVGTFGVQYLPYDTVSASFNPASVARNSTTRLTLTWTKNDSLQHIAMGFQTSLPAGLAVASTPNAAVAGCTNGFGTFSPAAGDTSLTITGKRITGATSSTCTFSVDVTQTTGGDKSITPGDTTAPTYTVGGSPFVGSAASPVVLTFIPAIPSIAVSPSSANIASGANLTLTATLSGGDSPTGSVTFKDGATTLGAGAISGSVATFSTTALAVGNHTAITAVYGGDVNNSTVTSSATSVTVSALVNGACAVSNVAVTAAPSGVAACTAGTLTNALTGTTQFTWDCAGSGGGTSTSGGACSVPRAYTVTPNSPAGGGVSPASAQTVSANATQAFTLTANGGNVVTAASGCNGTFGGTLNVSTSGTFTTAAITSGCSVSFGFAANAAPTASNVTVAGAAKVGTQLTGSFSYGDVNNDLQGTSTFKWYVDTASNGLTKSFIGGAIATSYTPVTSDAGKYLFFCVTPVAQSGTLTGTEICSVATAAVAMDGACGAAANVAAAFIPSANLCSAGTASTVSSASPWSWSCSAVAAGQAASCTAPNGTTATSSGASRAAVSGGGWTVDLVGTTNGLANTAGLIGTQGNAKSPGSAPPGVTFPHGLYDFTLIGGAGPATVILTYPSPLPAGTVYWKYGKTPTSGTAAWYQFPGAVISNDRLSITLTLTDGALGDDDATVNGTITDPGGPGVPGADTLNGIPTLSEWGLMLLTALLALLGMHRLRKVYGS